MEADLACMANDLLEAARRLTVAEAELAEARHAARGLEGELAEARAEVERAVNWRGTAEAAAINAIDRADRLREALDAVGALHEERKRDEGAGFYCPADGRTWPCPTAAIVQGATES